MSLGETFAVMDYKMRLPKHQRTVKQRKWQPKSTDKASSDRRWTWFFQGFGVGFALVSFIAGIWWFTTDGDGGGVVYLPPPELYIVPDTLIAVPGDDVILTPVPEHMEPPISIVWTADCGEGLPKGWAPETTVNWSAPDDIAMAHITATAKDSKHRTACGELTLPVIPPKQP